MVMMKLKSIYSFFWLTIVCVLLAMAKMPNITTYSLEANEVSEVMQTEDSFDKMMDVLTHQRCMNCHPNDNIPKQGDNRNRHYFGMARGEDGNGFQATNCHTCHQSENNVNSGVPGAPHWALAPASMGWEGLTRTEIAVRLLDKNINGNRSHEELVKHMTEDDLVLWAWDPGVDANGVQRTLPPISKLEFKEAVKNWFANGAIIPTK